MPGLGYGQAQAGGDGMDPMTMGSLIGAGVGGLGGTLGYMEQRKARKDAKKEAKRNRKERQFARIRDEQMQGQQARMAGMGLLAQASFDWASSLR